MAVVKIRFLPNIQVKTLRYRTPHQDTLASIMLQTPYSSELTNSRDPDSFITSERRLFWNMQAAATYVNAKHSTGTIGKARSRFATLHLEIPEFSRIKGAILTGCEQNLMER